MNQYLTGNFPCTHFSFVLSYNTLDEAWNFKSSYHIHKQHEDTDKRASLLHQGSAITQQFLTFSVQEYMENHLYNVTLWDTGEN